VKTYSKSDISIENEQENICIHIIQNEKIKVIRIRAGTDIYDKVQDLIKIPIQNFRVKYKGKIIEEGDIFQSIHNNQNLIVLLRLQGGEDWKLVSNENKSDIVAQTLANGK
jgi:glycosidase